MTINQLLSEWLYDNHADEIKERTFLRYESAIINHILPIIGDRDISNMTPRDIQSFLNYLKKQPSIRTNKPLSTSSLNTILTILKLAFGYANNFEITTNNPTTKIKRLKNNSNSVNINAFTREEQKKIERAIESFDNNEYFGIILVLYTGLRIGELLALTWKDINLKTGIMSITKTKYKTKDTHGSWEYTISTPKSSKSIREIPLPTFIVQRMKEIKKTSKSKYVVCKDTGEPILEKVLTNRYYSLLKKLGIRRLKFHCLRHTFATRALENKMDIKTLSEILGHANAATTLNIYTHSLMENKKHQMRKLKRLI